MHWQELSPSGPNLYIELSMHVVHYSFEVQFSQGGLQGNKGHKVRSLS